MSKTGVLVAVLALPLGSVALGFAATDPTGPADTNSGGAIEEKQFVEGPVRWQYSVVMRRGRAVRLGYQVPPIGFEATHAVVAASRRSVRITLYVRVPVREGPTPAAIGLECAEVRLRERVGRRRLVDGLTGRPPRSAKRRSRGDRRFERHLRKTRRCPRVAVEYKR